MRISKWTFLFGSALGALILARACGPGGDGVLNHFSLEEGGEFVVSQEWNEWTEPYEVDFWFKPAGGEWQWGRIDNDDTRWRKSSIQHDRERNSIKVYRGENLEAELFLESLVFELSGNHKRQLGQYEGELPGFLAGS